MPMAIGAIRKDEAAPTGEAAQQQATRTRA